MLHELQSVVLLAELPDLGLEPGDVGTVVLVHRGGDAYEVEFVTLTGETIGVVSLPAAQLRPIAAREIAHARTVDRTSDHP